MTIDPTQSKDILEALNIAALEPAEQEEILLDLNSLIFRGTMVRLMERMDEQTRDDFAKFVEANPSEEAITAFLAERVPDADSAVTETLQDLTDDILAVQSHLK